MRHETELQEDKRLFELVFEQSADALVIVDDSGRLIVANSAARRDDGLVVRLLAEGLTEGGELADFAATLRTTGRAVAERRVHDAEGKRRSLQLKGSRLAADRFAITLHDVTERVELEAELGQLRRVESLGYLTATVVHDFNNLLTPIVCLAGVLTRELERGSRAGEMAGEIRDTAERAAGLVRHVLSLLRRAPERPRTLDVGGLVS